MKNLLYKTDGKLIHEDFWIENAVEIKQEILPSWIQESFLNREYYTLRITKPIILYRVYGNNAKKQGGFASTEMPVDVSIVERKCAIKKEFDNSLGEYITIQVPIGTVLQVGFVAPQLANDKLPNIPLCQYKGGAVQVILPLDFYEKNPNAIIENRKTPNFIRPLGAATLHIYSKNNDIQNMALNILNGGED